MSVGRPLKFNSEAELQSQILEYLKWIQGEGKILVNDKGKIIEQWQRWPEPATITGLALYLGFESRQSFYDYESREEFSYTIKRARLIIENEYEKKLSGNNCTGAIFALKNLGWKDRTETELTGNVPVMWNEVKTYKPELNGNGTHVQAN